MSGFNLNLVATGYPGATKNAHFSDLAALLDPAAYVYHGYVGGLDQTVPAGESWYLLDAWNLLSPDPAGNSDVLKGRAFYRSPDARHALMLPAGTRIRTKDFGLGGAENGYAYVCRPSLVTADARYAEAETLYYQRIERLKSIALSRISTAVQAGDAIGTTASEAFGVSKALITHVSLHDGAWADLCQAPGTNTMNLASEISDVHQNRIGFSCYLPIKGTDFTHFRITNANAAGDGGAGIEALGSCAFHALPSDW